MIGRLLSGAVLSAAVLAPIAADAAPAATQTAVTRPAARTTLPAGFVQRRIATGLANPVDIEFSPDGRIFAAEQQGRVRVVRADGTLGTFWDISTKVSDTDERGLLGIAFDPDFATNHYVYLDYTRKATASRPAHNEVVRVTADGNKAVPGSEKVLLRLDALSGTHHLGGSLEFGRDGKLYIAAGDNQLSAKAQKLNNLFGKILRINKSGSIPGDNPFLGRTTGRNRAIWARGLRNPFKIATNPGSDTMFINDVGEHTWEEINKGGGGRNYGWPVHEGSESDPAYTGPVFAYRHGSSGQRGCAITGGTFYNPANVQFPASHVGDYFFADFCSGWIRRYDPVTDTAMPFASGYANAVIDLEVSRSGALFVLTRGSTGKILRIRHP